MKTESKIYIGLFIFLAIGIHFKQWTTHPIEHLINITHGGAYGIHGILHPFIFTLIVYIILWIPRLVMKFFNRKK